MSEGEKKLLLIKGALEFAGQEDSIFILDEPDSHIHINNKEQITKSFEPYQHNRQIIITTHSPTLTQCLKDENVYMLNSGKVEDKNRQEIIQDVTGEFWNKHQQNSFLSSKKPIILFVEGYHDKIHINNAFDKLKEEYTDLNFDIISVDGASNIPQLMTGLRTSDIKLNKLFIAVFDNDDEGKDNCNKTQVSYPSNINKEQEKGFYAIKYENDKKINKGDGFTVENMFESVHFEHSYIDALELHIGKFENKSIDKISAEIKKEAKSILSRKSKDFVKEDFKHFRKFFDLIRKINDLYKVVSAENNPVKPKDEVKSVIEQVQNISEIVEQKVAPTEIKPILNLVNLTNKKSGRTVTEKQHLTNKPPYVKKMYNLLKVEILRNNPAIEVKPLVTYIAFKRDKRNIFDIQIQGKKIILWVNKNKGELPATLSEIFVDCSEKGHQGNGHFEKHFENETEVNNFIMYKAIENILNL